MESGSREYGWASPSSDYDVRFVYKYPLKRYHSTEPVRRNITFNVAFWNTTVDAVGFDIHKFVDLLKKSNPTTIEWLSSNTVYKGDKSLFSLQTWIRHNFDPQALYIHYMGMAQHNFNKYIASAGEVPAKRYLYDARAALSALHLLYFPYELPPIDIRKVASHVATREYVPLESLENLIRSPQKRTSPLSDHDTRNIDEWLRQLLSSGRLSRNMDSIPRRQPSEEALMFLNDLIWSVVREE